ncbi:MAG: dihydroneopterin aldolase [Chitinophagales bacterium]|jgi:dihydroneopterin aldolase|nr:dihydroneopterin aldolase [Chitinophagales bacterium]
MLLAIEGMHYYAYHGYYPEEQIIGCWYTIDVYVTADFEAAHNDHLSDTFNYEQITAFCSTTMQTPVQLVEHLTQKIWDGLAHLYPTATALKVRISKHHPPLINHIEKIFVEIDKKMR